MGNSQQSPKYRDTMDHLPYVLPQKLLVDDPINSSFCLEVSENFSSPQNEELKSTARRNSAEKNMLQKLNSKNIIQNIKTEKPQLKNNLLTLACDQKQGELLNTYQSPSGHTLHSLLDLSIFQFTVQGQSVKYQGQLLNSHRDGFGLCFYENGNIYIGHWSNDKEEGHGRLIHKNGDCYTGFWREGMYDGVGMLQSDEMIYQGSWIDGQKNGQGLEIRHQKYRYEGLFRFGKKNGFGKITYVDNQYYEGEFKNGQYDGFGEYFWNDGRSYNGEWLNNLMHGEGTLINKNGDIYKGQFKFDKKDGIGTFKNSDGTILKGIWREGKLNGQATITNKNGESQVIEYQSGQRTHR